jgi:periplasmic copper chaperone A
LNTRTRTGRVIARLAPVILIALLVAACGGGSGSAITVTDPWSRTSPMVAGAGAAYMVVENTGSAADNLLGGRSDVAKAVEVHETYEMAPEPTASDGMGGGMMGMRRIDKLEIPAGGKVELKPGGYHIMLIDLTRELKAGETIEITLTFEKAGEVKVTAEVRAQ